MHKSKPIVQTLYNIGYGRERLRLVLNRIPQRLEVTPDELEKMMSAPGVRRVAQRISALYESYSEGSLLPARRQLGQELNRMAIKVAGIQPDEKSRKEEVFTFGLRDRTNANRHSSNERRPKRAG